MLLYNVGFGALTAGIGSVINKPKNVNWKHAFVRGAWQGAVGGGVNYLGKKSMIWVTKNESLTAAIPGRLIHSIGNSIVENASFYRPLFDSWSLDYTIFRFDYSFSGKKFRARLLPETVYAAAVAAKSGKFSASESLITGVLVFKSPAVLPQKGISYGRSIVYPAKNEPAVNRFQILSHELLHTFQYGDYLIFNSWLSGKAEAVTGPKFSKVFKKYVYADLPYLYAFYLTQRNHSGQHYFSNFYEFEAERFSTNQHVIR